ncbi:MAG: SUF system NifU family Fe-S cluster assembly protein [Wenzhouxiangellaceae bacterium]
MQHNRHPVGFRAALPHTAGWYQTRAINPLCGDEIELAAHLQPSRTAIDQPALLLSELAFCGDSCAICTASASMLCAQMPGQSARQAALLAQQFIDFVRQHSLLSDQRLQPLSVFAQLQQLPNRKSCAILPWQALQDVLAAVNKSEHQ